MKELRHRLAAALGAAGILVTGLVGSSGAVLASDPEPARSILHDPVLVDGLREGLDALYDREIDAARATFERLERRAPGHPVWPLLRAQEIWCSIILDPRDERHDGELNTLLDRALEAADDRLRRRAEDIDGRYVKATALAFRARLRSLRHAWVSAAWDGRRALGLLRELERLDPGNPDLDLGLGLYDYLAAVAPERYPILRPLAAFFPAGDRERGLERLRRVRERGVLARTEAAYFLARLRLGFEKDLPGALEEVRWLRDAHPDNPLFLAWEGRVLGRWGRCVEAGPLLDELLNRRRRGEPGYTAHLEELALYYGGRCDMAVGRLDRARERFDRLQRLAHERESEYRVLAHLRKGMVHDLLGHRVVAVAHYRWALSFPDSHGSAHEKARRYLDDAYRRPVTARLDGER